MTLRPQRQKEESLKELLIARAPWVKLPEPLMEMSMEVLWEKAAGVKPCSELCSWTGAFHLAL